MTGEDLFSPVNEKRLRELLRMNAVRNDTLEDRPRRAAAFLTLFDREETKLLLIRKKISPGYPWSGQVGMPGGFVEKADRDDLSTARRELEEELGIPPSDVNCLGDLGFFPTRITVVSLHVFVGVWNGEKPLRIDAGEIAAIVEIPVNELLRTHERKGFPGGDPMKIGVGRLRYPAEGTTVWGVTARVLFAFSEMALGRSR